MTIKKTYHYIVEHENEVPWDVVVEVILTTKGIPIDPNLIKFIRKSRKKEIYILCSKDINGNLKVINAKIRRR
ncbi:MAG: hypothetical protein ABIF11_00905 [Nitrospirota bacterium]